MKSTNEQVLDAVDGAMCGEQAEKFCIIRSHMNCPALYKLNLKSVILSVAEIYLPQLNLVMTVLGIQSYFAIGIISGIGVDMSVFPTSKHLCSWAGLTPQNNESAGKKKLPELAALVPTSNRFSFNVHLLLLRPGKSFPKSIYVIRG